jgi:hypothetical protein
MNATRRRIPEPRSREAAPVGAVVDCTTVVAAFELEVVVALATSGPEGDKLVKERVAELKVVFRGMAVPVPTKAELVMFKEPVAVTFDVGVAEYEILDDPVPPTREKRPE